MRGPIDYIIVGFENAQFDGSILRAVGEAIESGAISLLSMAVVKKLEDGTIERVSIDSIDDSYIMEFSERHSMDSELVSSEDIKEIGELLDEGSAAGMLVVEQLWAKPLKKAIIDANGFLVAEGRIHPDAGAELEN